MTAIININGIDKSQYVITQSVNLQRAITSQVDTITFDVVRKGGVAGSGYKPELLDTIEVIESGTTIFGGQIVQIDENIEGLDVETFHCSAKDYSYDMDRFLIIGTYENMTVDDIIDSINTNFLPAGYDISNVNCPVVIRYDSFNYELPTRVFQQLAELTNSDWYVNELKEIYFFTKTATPAPFDLTDTNENFYYNSLKIKNDIKSMRNSIIVRGGKYLGNITSEKLIADGTQTKFLQAYQYNTITVKVDSVSKTVGIDFMDDPASFDCLYNFVEKSISFPDASKPTIGQEVEVGGYPYIPVIVQVKDSASIANYGEFQFKIIDQSINSRQGAIDRARAEMIQWAQEVSDGVFETKQGGLQVGQKINVSSVIRGMNQNYIISRIKTQLTNGNEFLHSVTLMTTQTYGIIEFLQKLLLNKDKKDFEINPDELVESIINESDSMTFTDTVTVLAPTTGPYLWDDVGSRYNFATWA